mgnify:CR=1 FL=1
MEFAAERLLGFLDRPEDRGGRAAGVDRETAVALAVAGDSLELLEGCAAEPRVPTLGSRQVGSDTGAGNVAEWGEVVYARNELARNIPCSGGI